MMTMRSAWLATALVMVSLASAAPAQAGENSGEKPLVSCKKLPPDKPVVKVNLKPDTEVADLIGWMSTITCTTFLVPSTVKLQGRKVTVHSPNPITPREAYDLFVKALESVNLTVETSGKVQQIVELKKPAR